MNKKVLLIAGSVLVAFSLLVVVFVNQVPLGLFVGYRSAIQADYAYISDNEGVDIIHTANPSNPTKIDEILYSEGAWGMCINGNNLFIAATESLSIIDISDPDNIVSLGQYSDSGGFIDVEVEGGYAFCLKISGGLEILNVTDPSEITRVGGYSGVVNSRNLEIDQGLVYIADPNRGFRIINITDPASPLEIKTISNMWGVLDIYIDGNLLFLGCHGNGVVIFDISNPFSPSRLGSYSKPGGEVYGVAGNQTHLYIADLQLGIYSLNITDPNRPVEMAHNRNAAPHDLSFDGEFVYLADQDRKIMILSPELDMLYSGYTVSGFQISVSVIGFLIITVSTRKIRK
jgi:hypothetical protein